MDYKKINAAAELMATVIGCGSVILEYYERTRNKTHDTTQNLVQDTF